MIKNRLLKFISIVLILSVCTIILPSCSGSLEFTLSEDGTYYSVSIGTCKDKDIVIPAEYEGLPVKEIADKAFYDCYKIESITIPDTITTIGRWAFYNTKFTSFEIPKNVTFIGNAAFLRAKIKTIVIPDSVTEMGYGVFVESQLESVVIGNGLTEIPFSTFWRCQKLSSVQIPDNVKVIGKEAFYGTKLVEINLPDRLEEIGLNAFVSSNLKRVVLPDSVRVVNYAFDFDINEIVLNSNIETFKFITPGKTPYIYYKGTHEEFKLIDRSDYLDDLIFAYSETEPSLNEDKTDYDGNYWRYVDGVETPWVFNQA